MKIISKFKDYYDTTLAHGIDEKRLYIRHTESFTINDVRRELGHLDFFKDYVNEYGGLSFGTTIREYKAAGVDHTFELIFFCGKVYPLLKATYRLHNNEPYKTAYIYDAKKYEELLVEYDKPLYEKYIETKVSRSRWHAKYKVNWLKHNRDSMQSFMQPVDISSELFLKHKCPVMHFGIQDRQWVLTTNPCLKDYEFVKVKDPYTAVMELESFLSDQLCVPLVDCIEVSNETKIAKHGFDHKYAFRKEPKIA